MAVVHPVVARDGDLGLGRGDQFHVDPVQGGMLRRGCFQHPAESSLGAVVSCLSVTATGEAFDSVSMEEALLGSDH